MNDFQITDKGFQSTEVTITALTEKGKSFFATMFGQGAFEITLPKSKGIDFSVFAEQHGYTIS